MSCILLSAFVGECVGSEKSWSIIVGRMTFVMSQLSITPYGFLSSCVDVSLADDFTAHQGVSSTVIYACDTEGREKQRVYRNTNHASRFLMTSFQSKNSPISRTALEKAFLNNLVVSFKITKICVANRQRNKYQRAFFVWVIDLYF